MSEFLGYFEHQNIFLPIQTIRNYTLENNSVFELM